jgi:hypothetical protein
MRSGTPTNGHPFSPGSNPAICVMREVASRRGGGALDVDGWPTAVVVFLIVPARCIVSGLVVKSGVLVEKWERWKCGCLPSIIVRSQVSCILRPGTVQFPSGKQVNCSCSTEYLYCTPYTGRICMEKQWKTIPTPATASHPRDVHLPSGRGRGRRTRTKKRTGPRTRVFPSSSERPGH